VPHRDSPSWLHHFLAGNATEKFSFILLMKLGQDLLCEGGKRGEKEREKTERLSGLPVCQDANARVRKLGVVC
jgi:hypothetical protein